MPHSTPTVPTTPLPDPPFVSVVIPVLNEVGWLDDCIGSFDAQTHPHERLEVIVVDGGSTDGSRELIGALAECRPWLRLVDNPKRRAAAAFNRGVEAAVGDVICLVGAHAKVGPDYLERSVRALERTGAAGVGGRLRHEGTTRAGRAIGAAMTSRFGMASPFRFSATEREVDTIGHPAYRRAALESVGPFDESLERNSDYELNYRLRAAGHRLVLDPTIETVYRPRPSLRALGRQFFDYGRSKARVARRRPGSLRPRHLAPPVFAAWAAVTPLLLARGRTRRWTLVGWGAYLVAAAAAAAAAGPRRVDADPVVLVAAFPTMHLSWGAGLLRGLVESGS